MKDGYVVCVGHAGDILLNHNLTTFHSRTTWQDGVTEAEKRHMFRIWLASPLGWWAPPRLPPDKCPHPYPFPAPTRVSRLSVTNSIENQENSGCSSKF
jgi:hypothetical protein